LILLVAKSIHTTEQGLLQDLLRRARAEAKLTQLEVARRLRKPQSFVSKYESGERRLDLVELRQVCKALEVSLAEFARRFESATQDSRRGQ
jgi:transcriptional regulator with XRE-family HTH domain